jgi:hypothetical protein
VITSSMRFNAQSQHARALAVVGVIFALLHTFFVGEPVRLKTLVGLSVSL